MSASGRDKRVLLVGFRRPVADALTALGIPFAVWHDHPYKRAPDCLRAVSAPFPKSNAAIRAFVDAEFDRPGPFSHVIAGTESSVLPASVARRALGARKSVDTTVLRYHDKLLMKNSLREHGIPMTDYVPGSSELSDAEILDRLGVPVVVKEPRSSGGRGIRIVETAEGIGEGRTRRTLYERFVDAPEMSVESFVRDGKIEFVNTTGYYRKRCANVVPAPLENATRDAILRINADVIAALRTSWGVTHCEFYLTDRGPLFGEIALRPPGGYIMECISLAYGFDAWAAFVAGELDLPWNWSEVAPVARECAGAVVMHAGDGTLRAVHGVDEVRSDRACVRLRVLAKPGENIRAREGAGDTSAYGLFRAKTVVDLQSAIDRCLGLVRFEME